MTVTFKPSAGFSDGRAVCALSVTDALADRASGDDAYVPGSTWQAKWSPDAFRAAHHDNDAITGPVTVTWTWVRIEATTDDVVIADSFGGSTTFGSGAARATTTTTTTVTAPAGGWSKLAELHDVVVGVTAGGPDGSKVACVKAVLNVNTITAAATATPVVTIVAPPETVARSARLRVLWAFDHGSGLDQAEYRVKVFDGTPSPNADDDPTPLYDSGVVASGWSEHVISDALNWSPGLIVAVKARHSGGTWSSWATRTVTAEPLPTAAAPTVTASSDPVPTLTLTLTPQFASSGLSSVLVRGYHEVDGDPDIDDPDVELFGEVVWGSNLHPDPSFDNAAPTVTNLSGGSSGPRNDRSRSLAPFMLSLRERQLHADAAGLPQRVGTPRDKAIRARSGAMSLAVITAGGATDGAWTYSGIDTPRASHYRVAAWVWAPAGVSYDWGVRSVDTDLTTTISATTTTTTGTGNWQRHQGVVCPGGSGNCRVGFTLTSDATPETALYLDDVDIVEGRLPIFTCTGPLPNAVPTYWHARAVALSGAATSWGTSTTTPAYSSPPSASAATATADTINHRVAIAITRASGYSGTARLELQRSFAGRWVEVYGSGSLALNTTGASVTAYDRAAPSQSSPTYRYRLVGTANAEPKPGTWTTLATTGSLGAQNWLRDPMDANRDLRLDDLLADGFSMTAQGDGDPKRALGNRTPVLGQTRMGSWTIQASVVLTGTEERAAFDLLVSSRRTLLLQTAFGGQWWVRLNGPVQTKPFPTSTRATAPVDFVTVSFIEVAQPKG